MKNEFGTAERVTTLDEVSHRVDSTAKTYPALVGENLGHTTLKFSLPINQLLQMSQVANPHNIKNIVSLEKEYEAQRGLVVPHAKKLAQYTLMGLVKSEIKSQEKIKGKVSSQIYELQNNLGRPAYTSLQPMVTNIRTCDPGVETYQRLMLVKAMDRPQVSITSHSQTSMFFGWLMGNTGS